jgi:hypothetical protein
MARPVRDQLRDLIQFVKDEANSPGFWAGYLLALAYFTYVAHHVATT